MLRALTVLLGLIGCTCWLFGCSDSVTGPERLNKSRFPLKVGNQWTYAVSAERTVLSDQQVDIHEQWKTRVVWEIEAQEEVLGVMAFRINTTYRFLSGPDSGKTVSGQTWFAMKGDTLKAVASENIGEFDPLVAQLFKSSHEAETTQDPWNVNVLVFPLEVGNSWDFTKGLFPADTKTVAAIDKINTTAGEFQAFRVVREITAPDIQVITKQWFTSVGVVEVEDDETFVMQAIDAEGNVLDRTITVKTNASVQLESYDLK